jgi:CelD/BcsL family acetyltransferase involved in cellulose biosynthesis
VTAGSRVKAFPDLRATVHVGPVSDDLLDELPGLYGSLFATKAWFSAFDQKTPTGACVLDGPRHVLALCREGDTMEILNKAFPIAPADAARACKAVFRAYAGVKRIHLEVLFPPAELRLPTRVISAADDLVIELPDSADAYAAALGKKTRKNLRNYDNRLRRDHPDVITTIAVPPADETRRLAELYVAWNIARLHARGAVSGFQSGPERIPKLIALLQQGGAEAHVTTIEGQTAAVEFVFYQGDEATIYAGSFDETYGHIHLGFLSTCWAIQETIRRGARRCHLLWTTDYYKRHLGARPVTATRLSVFPTQVARLWSLREAREVAVRNGRERGRRAYWGARHAARRAAERAGLRQARPPERVGG